MAASKAVATSVSTCIGRTILVPGGNYAEWRRPVER
jgi:hypothetical protein